MTVGHRNHVPAQRTHRREGRLHRKCVFGDAPGQFCVIVGNDEQVGIDATLGRKTRNSRERFLGLSLHRSPVAHGANRDPIAEDNPVGNRQPLGLRQRGAERPVAQQDAFRIQVRFTVPGQFAPDAAKRFEVGKGQVVEAVVCPQCIDPVLGVARVVDEIESLVPLAACHRKHDPMNRRHDFRERGRPAPVTSRATVDGVHIHQRQQRSGGPRIGQDHFLPGCILDLDGVFRRVSRRRCESRFQIQEEQRRRLDLFDGSLVFSHSSRSNCSISIKSPRL